MDALAIIEELHAGSISHSEAVARLVALGFEEADAREQIYIASGGDDVVLEPPRTPRIDRNTAMIWWRYLDSVGRALKRAHPSQGTIRLPTNPRHTADCLKGGAMASGAAVDQYCRSFAVTRRWPDRFHDDELYYVQHRLSAAKVMLDFMTTAERVMEWNVRVLQCAAPDPLNESTFIEFLLIGVWSAMSEPYLDGVTADLQSLLSPEQLEQLTTENRPLQG
jgi:hypothetical protein